MQERTKDAAVRRDARVNGSKDLNPEFTLLIFLCICPLGELCKSEFLIYFLLLLVPNSIIHAETHCKENATL